MPPPSRSERRRARLAAFRTRFGKTAPGKILRFLPWPLQLALLAATAVAVPAGVVLLISDQYGRHVYGRQRIERVDAAIVGADPARGSGYCRGMFGDGPLYAACWAAERKAYAQFADAWRRGRGFSTLREQMLACFSEAQEARGTSWQTAATCSEADTAGAGSARPGP